MQSGTPRFYPVDTSGFRACQICERSVHNTPWVQIPIVRASDGKTGYIRRQWEEDDLADDEDPGPVLHVERCLEIWAWGISIEVQHRETSQ